MPPVLVTETVRLRHIFVFIVFAAVLSVVSSCRDDGRARGVLRLADSLMEERADSALAVLRRDSAMFVDAGEDVRMAYVLLKSEAEDKCYVRHTSDSAMLPVAEYFARHGEPRQSVRAWYVLGRFYCDLRLYGHALTAFDNALTIDAGDDSVACRYKARACTWTGAVYEERNLYGNALRYNKLSYKYAKKADVPSVEVYSLRDIGRSYSYLKRNNIAIPYYIKAATKAKALNDAYLYNMVMEELAAIYQEEGRIDDMRKALSAPFKNKFDADLAAHYFILSGYYEAIGQLDSAIYYNKLGMPYAETNIKMNVALDLARLYERTGNKSAAMKYYKKYVAYADTVAQNEVVEDADFLAHVERIIDTERENVALEGSKRRLTLLLSVIIFMILAVLFAAAKYYGNVKRRIREQQERVKDYLRQRREREAQSLKRNEARIAELEGELSSSAKELSDMRKKLMQSEMEIQANRNEQMKLKMIHRGLLEADFVETEVYKLYHNPHSYPTLAEYRRLEAALNIAYDKFTQRLKEFYPRITENEMWICCMVKIGLTSKEICSKSAYDKHSLGMAKHRLYGKMFRTKGSSKDLDNFIKEF